MDNEVVRLGKKKSPGDERNSKRNPGNFRFSRFRE